MIPAVNIIPAHLNEVLIKAGSRFMSIQWLQKQMVRLSDPARRGQDGESVRVWPVVLLPALGQVEFAPSWGEGGLFLHRTGVCPRLSRCL